MKCSFCKDLLIYVNKIERNSSQQQMILYKCKNCKIKYKTFRQENDLLLNISQHTPKLESYI